MSFTKRRLSNRLQSRSLTGSATRSNKYLQNEEKTLLLQKLADRDETVSIVYSIREELIGKALAECYARYIEKQSVKFVVHCAYRALTEITNLYFLVHDYGQESFDKHPSWIPDNPPEPSPPDTWAGYNVPVVWAEEETVEVEPPAPQVNNDDKSPISSLAVSLQYSSCASEEYTLRVSKSEETCGTVSLLGPNTSEVFLEEHFPDTEDVKKEMSVFTTLATLPKDAYSFRTQSTTTHCKADMSMPVEKKSTKNLTDEKMNMSFLPPIRADTIFHKSASQHSKDAKKDK